MFNVLRMITLYRMCELGDLTRECGAATPGIAKMYGIDADDVISIPSVNLLTHTITGNLILKPGKFFKDIPFVEQKAGLSDEIADAVGGGFKKNIPLKLSKYSPQTNRWILQAIGARFIIIIADNNGQFIIVGDKIASTRLEKATGTTGQKFGDENGWDMNLTAEGTRPCYFYTGAVVLQGAVETFDNLLTFSANVEAIANEVVCTAGATNATMTFEFDAIATPALENHRMDLFVGGVQQLAIDYPADYDGKSFRFTDTSGNIHVGVFTDDSIQF